MSRLVAVTAAVLTIAGLAVATPGAASAQTVTVRSASTSPWEVYSILTGAASFTRLGHLPGRVGNAHTGGVSFDTSDDPVAVNIKDWSCPDGATPPRYGIDQDTDTACQRLRWQTSELDDAVTLEEFWPTATGPLSATYAYRMGSYSLPDGKPLPDIDVDLRWSRTGPISRTRSDYADENVQSIDITLTAPMRLTGRIAGIDLGSPRTRTEVLDHTRTVGYSRRLG